MKRTITIEFYTPDHVYQPSEIEGFNVIEGDRFSGDLTFDEMLGQVISLSHPEITNPRYAMATLEQLRAQYPNWYKHVGNITNPTPPALPAPPPRFNLAAHIERQRAFSERTWGPGPRWQMVVDHIRKELREVEAEPGNVAEWADVVLLAFDGAWRTGATPEEIIYAIVAKQTKNEHRTWPDWRSVPSDKAIEHVRAKVGAA